MARKRKRKISRLALGASGEALASRPSGGRRGPVGQRLALGLLAAFLSVSVGPRAWAAEQTQTFQIAAGADDGHERNDGSVFLANQTITVGENRIPGFRFPGVPIPPGSLILSAKLRMYATADVNRTITIEYRAEAANSSAPFTSANYSFSQRALGANLVQDAPATWLVNAYNESPDLKLLLQEVVDRPGWASGNALSLFIRNSGGNNIRTIASKDNTANKPPELVVTWEPSPPPKTITVTGPNGGETWPLGSTQVVTWTSTNYIPSVKIELSRNSGTTWETLAASEPNDGIFPWLVQGTDTTAAMVRVSSASAPSIADASDAIFSITPQTVPTASLFQIVQGQDDGHERSDGSLALGIQTITLGVNRKAGFRFQNVQIPQGASIVSAKLRLYATADVNHSVSFQYKAEAADSSAPFAETVNNFTNRVLTAAVVYETPASWVQNAYAETVDLSPVVQDVVSRPGWVLGNALSLFVLDSAGADQRTVASKDNSANKPPELSVTWTTGTPPPQVRSISVVSPASGDTWEVGLKKDIRWSTTGSISQVMIEISRDNGTTWEVLSPAEQNDGLFTWPAVTGPPTTLAVVRVSDTTAPSTFGTSPTSSPFVIVDNPESITVIAPNGGETWPATTAQMIRWTWTGGIQKVKVEVSRNGGTTWELITQNANNDGDSNWTVTGPETTNTLIRVSAMDGSASDVSDAPFAIGAAPPPPPPPPPEPKSIAVSYPNGGEAWLVGNQVNIKWTSTGSIANVKIELSRDAGGTWEVVALSEANDGTFTWGNVTGPDSFSCLARIADTSDSTVRDTSNGVFSIVSAIQGLVLHLDGVEDNDDRGLILSQGGFTFGRVEAIGKAYPTAGIPVTFLPGTDTFAGGELRLTTDLAATTIPTATTLTLPEDTAKPGFSILFKVFATQTSEGKCSLKAEYGLRSHERPVFVTSEVKTISPAVTVVGQTTRHTIKITGPGEFPGSAASDGFVKVFPLEGVTVRLVSLSADLKEMTIDITATATAALGQRTISVETRRQFDKPEDNLGGTQVKAQQVVLDRLGLVRLDLDADTDRNGIVDDVADEPGEDDSTLGATGRGAILLNNCDDDDLPGTPGHRVPDNWKGDPIHDVPTAPDTTINPGNDLTDDVSRLVFRKLGPAGLPPDVRVTLRVVLPMDSSGSPLPDPEFFGSFVGGVPAHHRLRIFLPRREVDVAPAGARDLLPDVGDIEIVGPSKGLEARFASVPAAGEFDIRILQGTGNVVFAIEGLEFGAIADVVLEIVQARSVIARDRVRFRNAPFLLLPNNAEVRREVLAAVVPGFLSNLPYMDSFDALDLVPTDKIPSDQSEHDRWAQDQWEIGYCQAPRHGGGDSFLHVVLDLPRSFREGGLERLSVQRFLSDGVGVYLRLKEGLGSLTPEQLSSELDSINFGGNIECSGPVVVAGIEFPFGRVILGDALGTEGVHPRLSSRLLQFFQAQEVQRPFLIDVGWLGVGHVDEVVSMLPNNSTADRRDFKVAVASPAAAVDILARVGDHSLTIMQGRGSSWEMTVGDFLSNTAGIRRDNEQLDATKIGTLVDTLERELGIAQAAFLATPVLFFDEGTNLRPSSSSAVLTYEVTGFHGSDLFFAQLSPGFPCSFITAPRKGG